MTRTTRTRHVEANKELEPCAGIYIDVYIYINIFIAYIYTHIGRLLGPQTTRVRKAINKQDTRRMSNINNKNESCWRIHLLYTAPLHHSQHSHEWCLNGKCVSGSLTGSQAGRRKDIWTEWAARCAEGVLAVRCLFMLRLLAPLETRDLRAQSTEYRAQTSNQIRTVVLPLLESSANRKYLCIMQSKTRGTFGLETLPNNGNLLAENLIFMHAPRSRASEPRRPQWIPPRVNIHKFNRSETGFWHTSNTHATAGHITHKPRQAQADRGFTWVFNLGFTSRRRFRQVNADAKHSLAESIHI